MNPLIKKKAIKVRNKINAKSNQVVFPNIHSAGNLISINGINSSLSITGEGYMRDSNCQINGDNNAVSSGDFSMIVGKCSIRINGNNNHVEIGENCSLNGCSIFIAGDNNTVIISDKVSAVHMSIHMERDHNVVRIGEGTTLHGRDNGMIELVLEESTSIVLKEDCMISNDVCFRSSDSHSILNNKGERINPAGDIVINNHVWIGMHSIILKNTVVGSNCIVGAGSICNKNYKNENSMIAGNPAKIVKENVNWSRDRI